MQLNSLNITNIISVISEPRLSPYDYLLRPVCKENSLKSYFILTDLSSHFFSLLQMIEIGLKNKINFAMCEYTKDSLWFDSLTLTQPSKDLIQAARHKAAKDFSNKKTSPEANDIVARISFGYWVYWLDKTHSQHAFWDSHAVQLFGVQKAELGQVFSQLLKANSLRNRLYHNEPVWKKDNLFRTDLRKAINNLIHKYDEMLALLKIISDDKYQAIVEANLVKSFYDDCARYKSKYTVRTKPRPKAKIAEAN